MTGKKVLTTLHTGMDELRAIVSYFENSSFEKIRHQKCRAKSANDAESWVATGNDKV